MSVVAAPAGRWEGALRLEPMLAGLGVVLLAMVPPTVAAALFDGRQFLGIDIWLKPLKFEIALAIYVFTLAFYARWLPSGTLGKRWYRIYAGAVAFAILFEIAAIAGSAAEGTGSHFNEATPLHAAIYALMGVFATLLTTMALVYGVLIARSDRAPRDPALKAGLVLGLLLTFALTMGIAGFMGAYGSHFVGGSGTDAGGVPGIGMVAGRRRPAGGALFRDPRDACGAAGGVSRRALAGAAGGGGRDLGVRGGLGGVLGGAVPAGAGGGGVPRVGGPPDGGALAGGARRSCGDKGRAVRALFLFLFSACWRKTDCSPG